MAPNDDSRFTQDRTDTQDTRRNNWLPLLLLPVFFLLGWVGSNAANNNNRLNGTTCAPGSTSSYVK
jgi:hypothetical protein